MIESKKVSVLSVFLIMLVTLFFVGCAASFRGKELTNVTSFPPESEIVEGNKPSVYLESSWHQELWPFKKKPASVKSFTNYAIAITEESNLFSNISTNKSESFKMDYKIEIDMLNSGNWLLSYCLGSISGASLMIIPAYARDNYTLNATVSDSSGVLKKYKYKNHINSYFHLLLLPVAPFTKNTADKVMQNMLKHFFIEISKDNLIRKK